MIYLFIVNINNLISQCLYIKNPTVTIFDRRLVKKNETEELSFNNQGIILKYKRYFKKKGTFLKSICRNILSAVYFKLRLKYRTLFS